MISNKACWDFICTKTLKEPISPKVPFKLTLLKDVWNLITCGSTFSFPIIFQVKITTPNLFSAWLYKLTALKDLQALMQSIPTFTLRNISETVETTLHKCGSYQKIIPLRSKCFSMNQDMPLKSC
jgi:hypothetical protein